MKDSVLNTLFPDDGNIERLRNGGTSNLLGMTIRYCPIRHFLIMEQVKVLDALEFAYLLTWLVNTESCLPSAGMSCVVGETRTCYFG